MGRKLLALSTAIMLISGLFVVMAMPAFAWHAYVNGSVVCQDDGTATITWTISEPDEDWANGWDMIIDVDSSGVFTPGTVVNAGSPAIANQVVNANGVYHLSIDIHWTNGEKSRDYRTDSGQVTVECEEPDYGKVQICHATASRTNPYTSPEVNWSAADGLAGNSGNQPDHFGEHTGPVFGPDVENWGDIIPPHPGGIHSGLNWDVAGQAIYNNGCKFVEPEPEPDFSQTIDSICKTDNSAHLSGTVKANVEGWAVVKVINTENPFGLVIAEGPTPFSYNVPWPGEVGDSVVIQSGVDWGDGQAFTFENVTVAYPCDEQPEPVTITASGICNAGVTVNSTGVVEAHVEIIYPRGAANLTKLVFETAGSQTVDVANNIDYTWRVLVDDEVVASGSLNCEPPDDDEETTTTTTRATTTTTQATTTTVEVAPVVVTTVPPTTPVTLPFTGLSTGGLSGIAAALLALGGLLLLTGSSRQRQELINGYGR